MNEAILWLAKAARCQAGGTGERASNIEVHGRGGSCEAHITECGKTYRFLYGGRKLHVSYSSSTIEQFLVATPRSQSPGHRGQRTT